MTADNIVLEYLSAFNQNDRERMFSFLDESVAHEINQGEIEIGIEKFRQFMHHMDDCYQEHLDQIQILSHQNSSMVAAHFIVNGTYLKTDGTLPKAHGQKYNVPAGGFFTIKNNKITRINIYYNLNAWIKAVS